MKANSGLSALTLLGSLGLALAALPASALPITCDTDSDGTVQASEAATCAAERFDQTAGGQAEITPEQFVAAHPDAQGGADLFGKVDADASGAITREEWMTWREQRFGAATQGTGGGMPAADYETSIGEARFPQ